MSALNEMKITFLSRSSNEGFARVAVAAFVSQLDPTIEELTDIKTAVSEAVTNSIVHGYADRIGKIEIITAIKEGGLVEITVSDKGCGIADIEQAKLPLFTTCTTGERSGMGFTIMETFMDNLKVTSKSGKGTRVKMRKRLTAKE
jgi:stage II sporulation protein AB (anti-sigma F factor)